MQKKVKAKKTCSKQFSTFSHISSNASNNSTHVRSHALALIRSPSHPHTCTNSCSIDNITYFLPTVIWLLNCLQSVSPGNSWASSALFSTPNKDSFLIGPALPLSLFSHQSEFLFTAIDSHSV